jgi:hypothetical protein
MMAFWSDLVNKHHLEVKEACNRLLARSTRGSVVSDLLATFMGAMQFSTLPIHDRQVNPMYLNGEFGQISLRIIKKISCLNQSQIHTLGIPYFPIPSRPNNGQKINVNFNDASAKL